MIDLPYNKNDSLVVTSKIDSQKIAYLSLTAFEANPPDIQEILIQSKSEQTFSGLLADQIKHHEEFSFKQTSVEHAGVVLLEFKGTDYQKIGNGKVKHSRNFHDISIVNGRGELEIVIENKFWYHFDGSKGTRKPVPYVGIRDQIEGDIYKIRHSFSTDEKLRRGFVLIHLVTPLITERLPKAYQRAHHSLWERAEQNSEKYRRIGLGGVLSVLSGFLDTDLDGFSLASSPQSKDKGFIDVICAEVRL